MSVWLRRLLAGLRALVASSRVTRELDDEIQSYVDMLARAKADAGMDPARAARAARADIGGVPALRERLLDVGWERAVESARQDLRYGLRQLVRQPLFTGAAALTLALAIGANSALFAIVNAFVLRPLPFPHAERLVSLSIVQKGEDFGVIDEPTARLALATPPRAFEALAAYDRIGANVSGAELPERVQGARVSERFFDLFGVQPVLGRTFTPDEMRPGGPKVVVLGAGLWRQHFGDSGDLTNRTVTFDDESYVVIGIMPVGVDVPEGARFWLPRPPRAMPGGGFFFTNLVGRLVPSATPDTARDDVASLRTSHTSELPGDVRQSSVAVLSLHERQYGGLRQPLLLLWGIVSCVLLIACANVANLLFARAAAREHELVLRAAIGASRGRIVRQLLIESLLLAGLGAIPGLLLAEAGLQAFRAFGPRELVELTLVAIDYRVLVFTLVAAVTAGILFGVAPAMSASRSALQDGLKGLRGRRRRGSGSYPRQTLVALELGIALALTIGGALLAKSFVRFQAVDDGFDADRVVTATVSLPRTKYADASTRRVFYDRVSTGVRAIPSVEASTITSIGVAGMSSTRPWRLPGGGAADTEPLAIHNDVGLGHFRTFGIRILDGAECSPEAATPEAVINQRMARRAFADKSPIGQRVDLGDEGIYTVVGVSADIRNFATKAPPLATVHTCAGRAYASFSSVIALRARQGSDVASLGPAVRRIVAGADPSLPVASLVTVSHTVRNAVTTRWFEAALVTAFAALAFVLAIVGVYAVAASLVAQRTREMGIRIALGATRTDVLRLVLTRGGVVTAVGICLGFAGAAALVRSIGAMLFDVARFDALVFLSTTAVLAAVSMMAVAIPAWRAARVNPLIALQSD